MTSCPPTLHLRSPRFRSAVEAVAVELEHLVLVAHRDQPDPRVTQVLPDLRAMLVNADQKALGVFRVLLVPLVAELEEPRFPDPKDLGVLLALLDQRGSRAFRVLLVPLERTDNLAQRARMEQLVPLDRLDPKDLPDLQESVVPPVRMQLLLSSIGISPRTRQPRPTVRRLTSRTHSDRRTPSRTALGTTPR